MSKENIVDEETALSEFDRFADLMDLDVSTDDLDAEDLTAFLKSKRRITSAIMRGSLVINEDGEAVYSPSNSKSKCENSIIFHERTGASSLAMDGKKKNQSMKQTYAVMAEMCKITPGDISKLVGVDIKTCEAIFTLLMD